MTAPRDDKVFLEDILTAITNIEKYIADLSLETFRLDAKTQDAVVRNLEIIGEAAKRISGSMRHAYPDIEWKPAAAMRDFLIHEYPDVDVEAVWDTIKTDLPAFKTGITRCLSEALGKTQ
ncbi:hypothetical protein A3I46_00205 [Candidatus Kaiserbacteria bacterium RIFCSPLOWO2_02_FULL_54_13]|uniref:DUF86 domain-containing protein n=1 Tax=Candidatus Kaiserbacteria bacterium RIFCSPHIGHO2_02_FULL_54_22 TaxID=1798495 RepID=A0A1F6DMV6_9BACT|nr:MAG: hypothetical protein A3C19_02750 [Candidatus Kaiserbacteria bacterium RIFCSPHIGHO2_02_FULL_54_22]OGG68235.1 MAG: hypothetical protein A3E99_00755 [Candidatus Kaiserbacteria bacterium RIFCSPHIGHO2_12_FULL_54_16]OGG82828.1 MAG: hypothetical protein A3I46_00205 [Candidatus Kaiserbacteria bacterium RIFCSPLOWO2_02_FULL_54_13]OGG90399.1 MAG: hypothetical protein A3G12_00365 [Candidatus Kaiserbacteria bacterium RIFCSPLOWO2_12_FULL_54_10]